MYSGKFSIWGREYHLRDITLFLAVASIPFNINLNSWSLVFFCVVSFFSSAFKEMPRKLVRSRLWMISAAYFFWLALTYFWDSSGGFIFKDLERYGAFLIFPFVLTIITRIPIRIILTACQIFVLAIVSISLICLFKSVIEYQHTQDNRVFFYHYLSLQMNLNAIILSNYCLECIAWLLFCRFMARTDIPRFPVWLTIAICSFLALMIFLLSSKLIIFLFVAIGLSGIIYSGYASGKKVFAWLMVGLVLMTSFLLIFKLPYLRWRITVTDLKEYKGETDNQNGLAARRIMWQSALDLIRKRPVAGYGIVGAKQELFKEYEARHFDLGYAKKYNVHNQYLDTTLTAGLIGLVIYLCLLARIGLLGLRQKNYLLLLMLFHFLCMAMVETSLDVQQELVFFLFFIFLFCLHFPKKEEILGQEGGQG